VSSRNFRKKAVYFNRKKLKNPDKAKTVFNIIKEESNKHEYAVVIVSLSKKNLSLLLSNNELILDFILKQFSKSALFIFGASSLFPKIDPDLKNKIFYYPRPGVSKTTLEFKNAILNYIGNE